MQHPGDGEDDVGRAGRHLLQATLLRAPLRIAALPMPATTRSTGALPYGLRRLLGFYPAGSPAAWEGPWDSIPLVCVAAVVESTLRAAPALRQPFEGPP